MLAVQLLPRWEEATSVPISRQMCQQNADLEFRELLEGGLGSRGAGSSSQHGTVAHNHLYLQLWLLKAHIRVKQKQKRGGRKYDPGARHTGQILGRRGKAHILIPASGGRGSSEIEASLVYRVQGSQDCTLSPYVF